MSREDIVAIAVRLLAIYLVVQVVRSLGGVAALAAGVAPFEAVTVIALIACPLLAAVLMWIFPVTIARRLLPVMRTPAPAIDPAHLTLRLALTVLGLWVLARGLVDAAYWASYARMMREMPTVEFTPDQKANMVATAVEVAIGLWLVCGGPGLRAIALRLRYAGARFAAPAGRTEDDA